MGCFTGRIESQFSRKEIKKYLFSHVMLSAVL